MKKSLKALAIVSGAVALAMVVFLLDLLRFSGTFHAFNPRFAGSCVAVATAGSSEDIQVDAQRGLAYLSVLDRASLARHEPVDGTVMLLDLNLAEPAPRAAMAYDPPGFRPHGLSIFTRSGEPVRLFAISHRPDGSHTVEIAEQDANGALDEVVPLGSAPDNLKVDADGVLWIAAHPKLLAFAAHVRRPGRRAPTQVLRFDPRGPKPAAGETDVRLSQVYGNDGTQLSAGTAAAHWHGEFLIGALFDSKVLICKPSP